MIISKKYKISKRLKCYSKEFDSDPVYNKEYLKAKIKFYNEKINTHSQNNKIPKEGSHCICLPVILINSVFRTSKNHYPEVFSKEYKYVVKEKKLLKRSTLSMT